MIRYCDPKFIEDNLLSIQSQLPRVLGFGFLQHPVGKLRLLQFPLPYPAIRELHSTLSLQLVVFEEPTYAGSLLERYSALAMVLPLQEPALVEVVIICDVFFLSILLRQHQIVITLEVLIIDTGHLS